MADGTKIEWTEASWNPLRGCSRVSQGCVNCYAEIMAARFSKPGQWGHSFAEIKGNDHRWTGRVAVLHERLDIPLRWKRPRKIFVNSTSDLFHENLSAEDIAQVIAYVAASYWHTHQVLTKRPDRAHDLLTSDDFRDMVDSFMGAIDVEAGDLGLYDPLARRTDDWRAQAPDVLDTWPLPNLWLGVSVEDQKTADARIPDLLATPAAIRFASYEPALGPINFRRIRIAPDHHTMIDALDGYAITDASRWSGTGHERPMLDQIIMGGESGPGARPMHPDWARSTRDQCAAAGTAFFFKQWGEYQEGSNFEHGAIVVMNDGRTCEFGSAALVDMDRDKPVPPCNPTLMLKVGKHRAGRLLDGVEHNAFPEVRR